MAYPITRSSRAAATQGALLAAVAGLVVVGLSTDSPSFWPLAVFAAGVPWLPLPGRPGAPSAMRLALSLLATTLFTHAVFFGEDRYHVVVTPVLALLAAAALRPISRAASLSRSGLA